VQFETVWVKAMGGISVQILWKVDDGNGIEGTLLDANTTADAQFFRDECRLGLWTDFDAMLPDLHDGAVSFALLSTLFRLASVLLYNRDANQPLRHLRRGADQGTGRTGWTRQSSRVRLGAAANASDFI